MVSWFDLSAYLHGEQPLWRAFWIWSIGGCGTLALAYDLTELGLSDATVRASWAPFMRILAVWTVLGILSLAAVVPCRANTNSRALSIGAFIAIAAPTALFGLTLLRLFL